MADGVGVALQEEEEPVQVVQRLLYRGPRHAPLEKQGKRIEGNAITVDQFQFGYSIQRLNVTPYVERTLLYGMNLIQGWCTISLCY